MLRGAAAARCLAAFYPRKFAGRFSGQLFSYVEVLGFHKLDAADRAHFEAFFAASTVLLIDQVMMEAAVKLRQMRRISLGDAFIAATCWSRSLTLATHNVSDFTWIADLSAIDPLANTERKTD